MEYISGDHQPPTATPPRTGHRVLLCVAMVAAVAIWTTGCSGHKNNDTDTDLEQPARPQVSIDECRAAQGTATAFGTVRNDGDTIVTFTLTVGFYEPGTNTPLSTGTVTVKPLAPGKAAAFEVSGEEIGLTDIECRFESATTG